MLALDHLVYATVDADAARLMFSERYGLATYKGGRHENWGTYNYLSHFQNQCYMEWLSLFDGSKAAESSNPLIQHTADWLKNGKEGIIQLAFRTSEMDQFIEYYRKNALSFQGPFEGSRKRPDGSVLAWRMLFPESSSGNTLPFLIEWDGEPPTPEDPSLVNKVEIESVMWGTEELEQTKQMWMKMFQLPALPESAPVSWKLTNAEVSLVSGSAVDYYLR